LRRTPRPREEQLLHAYWRANAIRRVLGAGENGILVLQSRGSATRTGAFGAATPKRLGRTACMQPWNSDSHRDPAQLQIGRTAAEADRWRNVGAWREELGGEGRSPFPGVVGTASIRRRCPRAFAQANKKTVTPDPSIGNKKKVAGAPGGSETQRAAGGAWDLGPTARAISGVQRPSAGGGENFAAEPVTKEDRAARRENGRRAVSMPAIYDGAPDQSQIGPGSGPPFIQAAVRH